MALCNANTKTRLENQLLICLEIIQKYEWLHNTLLHDFFVEKHWQSIPKGWRTSLDNLSPTDLSNLLNYWENSDSNKLGRDILPLELLALKACVAQYSLNRQPVKSVYEALNIVYSPYDGVATYESGNFMANNCTQSWVLVNENWEKIEP